MIFYFLRAKNKTEQVRVGLAHEGFCTILSEKRQIIMAGVSLLIFFIFFCFFFVFAFIAVI